MNENIGPSKLGVVAAILLAILAAVIFNGGWLHKWVSDSATAVPVAAAATVSPEPGATRVSPETTKQDDRSAYIARRMSHDVKWWEGPTVNQQTGEGQVQISARDRNATEIAVSQAYDSGDTIKFLTGPDGYERIPYFSYVMTSGLFRASISDPDSVYRFQYDQSIKVVFIFVNEKGIKHHYTITGYRGESGSVVFLKDEALSIMDLFMTSRSMVARVPTYGDYREMRFDCTSFDAKPFLRTDLTVGDTQ